MHAVDHNIPRDQVLYDDVNPGVLWYANHWSGDLQLLAALSKRENLEARPRFVFRKKCAFANLEFDGERAVGQNSRRMLIRIRCDGWQRGVAEGGCLAVRGSEKSGREHDQEVRQDFGNTSRVIHGDAIIS